MKNERVLPKRFILVSAGIFLLGMMAIGSACDYSISKLLYHPGNLFGIFFAAFGGYPMGLGFAAAGAMLISARNPEKKLIEILQVILGAFLILTSVSMLVQMPIRHASMSIWLSAVLGIGFAGITVWGTLRLCKGADRGTVIRIAIAFVLVIIAETIVVDIIKIPWGRARMRLVAADSRAYFMPWWQPGTELRDALVAIGVAAEEFKSFPSGHTVNASALMLLCLLPAICSRMEEKRTLLFWVGFAWTCLVAVSRITMGAHYLTDTTVGFAVGFIVLVTVVQILFRQKKM